MVQQALQAANGSQPNRNGTQPSSLAAPSQEADSSYCAAHGETMKLRRNAKGSWYSHWLATEERWCKGE